MGSGHTRLHMDQAGGLTPAGGYSQYPTYQLSHPQQYQQQHDTHFPAPSPMTQHFGTQRPGSGAAKSFGSPIYLQGGYSSGKKPVPPTLSPVKNPFDAEERREDYSPNNDFAPIGPT